MKVTLSLRLHKQTVGNLTLHIHYNQFILLDWRDVIRSYLIHFWFLNGMALIFCIKFGFKYYNISLILGSHNPECKFLYSLLCFGYTYATLTFSKWLSSTNFENSCKLGIKSKLWPHMLKVIHATDNWWIHSIPNYTCLIYSISWNHLKLKMISNLNIKLTNKIENREELRSNNKQT